MTDRRITDLIPQWPYACSAPLLALKCGFLHGGCSKRQYLKGMQRFERRLSWLTLREPRISESRAVVQRSTIERLEDEGFTRFFAGGEEMSYFSMLPQGGET